MHLVETIEQFGEQSQKKNDDETSEGCVTVATLRELIEKQQYRCALSGQLLTPQTTSLDHIVPLCDGGTHTIGNVWLVTKDINRMKSTMSVDQFVAVCASVVATSMTRVQK